MFEHNAENMHQSIKESRLQSKLSEGVVQSEQIEYRRKEMAFKKKFTWASGLINLMVFCSSIFGINFAWLYVFYPITVLRIGLMVSTVWLYTQLTGQMKKMHLYEF